MSGFGMNALRCVLVGLERPQLSASERLDLLGTKCQILTTRCSSCITFSSALNSFLPDLAANHQRRQKQHANRNFPEPPPETAQLMRTTVQGHSFGRRAPLDTAATELHFWHLLQVAERLTCGAVRLNPSWLSSDILTWPSSAASCCGDGRVTRPT
jgi:hypothetical protein